MWEEMKKHAGKKVVYLFDVFLVQTGWNRFLIQFVRILFQTFGKLNEFLYLQNMLE